MTCTCACQNDFSRKKKNFTLYLIRLNKNGKNPELCLIHAYYYETKTRFDLLEKMTKYNYDRSCIFL